MACEHPKSFISKILSPKSEQVQTLTVKSHMKVKNISILRTKSPVKEIPFFRPFFGNFNIAFKRLATGCFRPHFFNFSTLRHQKADLWAWSPGIKCRHKKHGVYVGVNCLWEVAGKEAATIRSWFQTKMEMDPKARIEKIGSTTSKGTPKLVLFP